MEELSWFIHLNMKSKEFLYTEQGSKRVKIGRKIGCLSLHFEDERRRHESKINADSKGGKKG